MKANRENEVELSDCAKNVSKVLQCMRQEWSRDTNYLQVFEVGDDVEVFEIEAIERDQGEFEQGFLGVGQHLFEAWVKVRHGEVTAGWLDFQLFQALHCQESGMAYVLYFPRKTIMALV